MLDDHTLELLAKARKIKMKCDMLGVDVTQDVSDILLIYELDNLDINNFIHLLKEDIQYG